VQVLQVKDLLAIYKQILKVRYYIIAIFLLRKFAICPIFL